MIDYTTVHKTRKFGRVTIEYVTVPDQWAWEDLGDMLGEFKYQHHAPESDDSDLDEPLRWHKIWGRSDFFWWQPSPEDEHPDETRKFIENICTERISVETVGVRVLIDGIKRGTAYCGLVTVEKTKDIYDAIKEHGLLKEAWSEAMKELATVYANVPRRFRNQSTHGVVLDPRGFTWGATFVSYTEARSYDEATGREFVVTGARSADAAFAVIKESIASPTLPPAWRNVKEKQ